MITHRNTPLSIRTPLDSSAGEINRTLDHRRLMSGVSDVILHGVGAR